MNSVLEEALRTGHVKSVTGNLVKLHSAISHEEGTFLQRIISEIKPLVSLEVGLAYGISALFICEALEKTPYTRHIIIDPDQFTYWENIGLNNLERAGYGEMIEFYNLPSHLALPQFVSRGCRIDFAFIDGWHTFDQVLIDFFYIDRLLRVGGIIALDDANWPSIRKVCRFVATNRSYSVFRCLPTTPEFTLSWKGRILRRVSNASERVRHVLKPEFVQPDVELGLVPGATCIALRKEADDGRQWDFHREF